MNSLERNLRVINIRYLNSIPYRVLQNDLKINYQEGLPLECAAALLQKDVDLGLLPLASIVKHGLYKLLPYGIVADGAVESVFLFSDVAIEDLESISLDVSSETSVILLKTLIYEFYPALGKRVKFKVDSPEQVLNSIKGTNGGFIIGDHGLTNSSRFAYTLDLAAEWKRHTGAPFLFAAWAHRPSALSERQIANFERQVAIGLSHKEIYARDWAETQGINREEAMRYVGKVISYNITPIVKEAASEFIRMASSHNLIPGELAETIRTPLGRAKNSVLATRSALVPIDVVIYEAVSGRRLSIGSALQLVENLSLSELAEVTNQNREAIYSRNTSLHHLSLCSVIESEESAVSKLKSMQLSPDQILNRMRQIPEDSTVLIESWKINDLTLEYFKDLIKAILKNKKVELAALSVNELLRISDETKLPLQTILADLKTAGLKLIGGVTSELLCSNSTPSIEPLRFLEIQRVIAEAGFEIITNLRISSKCTLMDYAIHLFHLRQLQDQTNSIKIHFVDALPTETKLFNEDSTPGWYFRAFCLSRLILDNVLNIEISPRVFGKPVAEVASALASGQDVSQISSIYRGVVVEL